jgi:MtN3 and saliva related transmembrane protein
LSFTWSEGFGFVGAGCTTLSFVPQVLKVWRSRSAHDISAGMYLLFITGLAFWLAYGLSIGSWPILIANTLTIVLAAAVLGMKWHFERRFN